MNHSGIRIASYGDEVIGRVFWKEALMRMNRREDLEELGHAAHHPFPLSMVARAFPVTQDSPGAKEEHQVMFMDCFDPDSRWEERLQLLEGGCWIRHSHPLEVGTRVLLHLLLPAFQFPLALVGRSAKVRREKEGSWMLIWFEPETLAGVALLRGVLQAKQ